MSVGGFEHDDSLPAVVFLGPSLTSDRARRRLHANYQAPARMGDIYRLTASGARVIVLIDGVFQASASVWHREILDAIAQGVRIIGAASMGALRASELHALGMIGVGEVFEWYRDGIIDGDDEVALLHGDAESEFRPLSQPLVNIRHRLRVGVERGDLEPARARAIIAHVKRSPFTRRTHAGLLTGALVRGWPASARTRLRALLDDPTLDLKAQDAEQALDHAAVILEKKTPEPLPDFTPSRFYLEARTCERGLLSRGRLVAAEVLWAAIGDEDAPPRARLVDRAARRFYLGRLIERWKLDCTNAYNETFTQRWDLKHGVDDSERGLRTNGLTAHERRVLLRRRAAIAWMLERGPRAFDLDPSPFSGLPALWAALDVTDPDRMSPSELCFLLAWAQMNGLSCPERELQQIMRQLEQFDPGLFSARTAEGGNALMAGLATGEWLIRKKPRYFGYTSWSPLAEVIQDLQLTGRAAQIIFDLE